MNEAWDKNEDGFSATIHEETLFIESIIFMESVIFIESVILMRMERRSSR